MQAESMIGSEVNDGRFRGLSFRLVFERSFVLFRVISWIEFLLAQGQSTKSHEA
jgi:hypothetical protein